APIRRKPNTGNEIRVSLQATKFKTRLQIPQVYVAIHEVAGPAFVDNRYSIFGLMAAPARKGTTSVGGNRHGGYFAFRSLHEKHFLFALKIPQPQGRIFTP